MIFWKSKPSKSKKLKLSEFDVCYLKKKPHGFSDHKSEGKNDKILKIDWVINNKPILKGL